MPKTIETISHIRVGNVEHPIDAVTINGRQIPSASELLPNVSSSDNGKILRVLNGQWSLFSPGSLYDEINGIDCGDTIKYEEQYLSLEIITGGTIGFKNAGSGSTKTIQYSVNDGVWTSLTAGDPAITVSAGDVIRLKGTNTSYALSNQNYSGFGLSGATATYNVYGNIMSLIYGDNFIGQTTLTDDYAFCCLFDGSKAVSAENLILPADTLTKHCYRALFANCSNLTTGPTVLPATTLAESCYRFMFSADSLLVNAPVLPATTLAKESYYGLFNSCSSLNYIKCLATNISASNSTKQWVTGVASTGTFVKDPNMAGWTVNSVDGIPVGWTVEDNEKDYLTFDIKTDGNITWKMTSSSATAKTISYSKNGGEWTEITSSTEGVSISVVTGDEVRFKGSNNVYGDASFGGTSQFDATGNIMSLIGGDGFDDTTTLSTSSFSSLFKNCTGLKSAEDLLLPATTLTQSCYVEMFRGCTGLTAAPALPATTLYHSCYNNMFNGCTSLTTAPSINSTTLPPFSCVSMFRGCTSLTTVPTFTVTTVGQRSCESMFQGCTSLTSVSSLPATTLGEYCYANMFEGCTNLVTIPSVLPATTLVDSCYYQMFKNCTDIITPPSLPATTLVTNGYYGMFEGCTSLTTAPALPATTLANNCYGGMFRGCTSLTTAPDLPATTLVNICYSQMFYGCTNLNYIKCLATNDNLYAGFAASWTYGVSASGTFVKDASATSWPTGENGIPVGWIVEDIDMSGDSDSDSEGGDTPIDYANEYLTFDVKSDGNITWKMSSSYTTAKTISYSKNDGEWTNITSTTSGVSIPVVTGDKVRFKGSNSTYSTSNSYDYANSFGGTATFDAYGNIMSLIGVDDFSNLTTLSSYNTFLGLFYNCTGLLSAENLILPATTLVNYCYSSMFRGCTSLTTAPELPVTTLVDYCYAGMFSGCSSITTVPELSATTLANWCYNGMFYGCTSLTTTPELPATTLAAGCYASMFNGCTGLTTAPELPVTTLANYCYSYMFQDCTGLTTAPELPATILTFNCYYSMFKGCTGLTTAPELPATTLVQYCYGSMFYGCTNLNYIKCLATDISSTSCTANWVYGVANSGTFVKDASMTSWVVDSVNGIPVGWTVNDYVPDSGDSESESESEIPTPIDQRNEYLTFNITSAGNIATSVGTNESYEYQLNDGTWTSVTSTISVSPGDVVKFRGDCVRYNTIKFSSSTCGFTLSGNLMSIYDADNFASITSLTISDCFSELFKNCTGLTSAEDMVMPATSLVNYCYSSMFEGCTSLTTPPVLPASTLAEGSYGSMFKYCSNLNYIKCLATDISARYCVDSWVQYVAASGTFVKADSMEDWTINSISGIPVGWTLINASDESGQDEGDSDSDYGDSDSEEPVVITVSAPEVSYSNNTVTITCETTGATIYYKLGQSGTYQEYTAPIALTGSVDVYTYATLNDVDSEEVTESCEYDYSLDYLTFDILTSGTILWDAEGSNATKTIEYSINDGTWTSVTSTGSGVAINVTAGDSVRFRGSNSQYCNGNKSNYSRFGAGTATFNISGNIMSMTAGDNFANVTTLPATWTFTQFFKESKPVSAENLILPATTMTECCYRAMFSKCTTLEKAPALPATTLANNCYWYLFEDCAITKAPDLPATTLVNSCYGYMFTGCTSLNYIKCMATTGFNTTSCLQNWVNNVAATGTFVKDANTSSWTVNSVSGIPVGWTVFDGELVEDPVIDFNGENKIEISCETSGATIYYKLGNSGNYSVYTGPITITEDATVYTYAEKDGQQSQTVSQECEYSEHIYKFGDLVFASGPLYYGNDGYEIKDSWNYSSSGTVYGKNVGSTFFNFIEMGDLFKKSGFSASDGQILNILDPFDGWRLPTKDEWDYIVGSTRPGSTVNGVSGKHYAIINFDHDNNQNTASISGLLIFPDNETITGTTLSYFDSVSTNVITLEQFNNYLSQGCVFLQASGLYQTTTGFLYGNLNYWSSSDYSESTIPAYALRKYSEISTSLYNKEDCYLPVYLVRDTTYGKETPLEGATKSLNTWTI